MLKVWISVAFIFYRKLSLEEQKRIDNLIQQRLKIPRTRGAHKRIARLLDIPHDNHRRSNQ